MPQWIHLINKHNLKHHKGKENFKKKRKKWLQSSSKIRKSFKKLMEINYEKLETKWKNKIKCKQYSNNHSKIKFVLFVVRINKNKNSW